MAYIKAEVEGTENPIGNVEADGTGGELLALLGSIIEALIASGVPTKNLIAVIMLALAKGGKK